MIAFTMPEATCESIGTNYFKFRNGLEGRSVCYKVAPAIEKEQSEAQEE